MAKLRPKRKPKKPKARGGDFKRTMKIADDIIREYPETLAALAGTRSLTVDEIKAAERMARADLVAALSSVDDRADNPFPLSLMQTIGRRLIRYSETYEALAQLMVVGRGGTP